MCTGGSNDLCESVSPSCLSLLQSPLEYITMAAISKIFAVAVTYPYQVVRARLQDQHNNYSGIVDVIRRTWRYESHHTHSVKRSSISITEHLEIRDQNKTTYKVTVKKVNQL